MDRLTGKTRTRRKYWIVGSRITEAQYEFFDLVILKPVTFLE